MPLHNQFTTAARRVDQMNELKKGQLTDCLVERHSALGQLYVAFVLFCCTDLGLIAARRLNPIEQIALACR